MISDPRSNKEAMLSLLSPAMPKTPWEQMKEKHGAGESFLRMLGTGLSGGLLGNLLMPEMSKESKAQYATDMDLYKAQKAKMFELDLANQIKQQERDRLLGAQGEFHTAFTDGDVSNDPQAYMTAIAMGVDPKALEVAYGDDPMFEKIYARNNKLPDATRAVLYYQDSMNTRIGEDGQPYILPEGHKDYVKYSDAYNIYKSLDPEAARELAQAKKEGALAGEHGQTAINSASAEMQTISSAMEAIEGLGQIGVGEDGGYTFTPDDQDGFNDVYGTLDQLKPFPFGEGEALARATVDQLQSILAVDARAKLKGQGQISDKETEMLAKSLTILSTRGISAKKAREEIAKIYGILQKGYAQKEVLANQDPVHQQTHGQSIGHELPPGARLR